MFSVEICVGSHCSLVGALSILDALENLAEENPGKFEIKKISCTDNCKGNINNVPVVKVEDELILSAKNQVVLSKVMERLK